MAVRNLRLLPARDLDLDFLAARITRPTDCIRLLVIGPINVAAVRC